MNNFIVMRSGTEVDLDNPTTDMIRMTDIAFHTARTRRFTGATLVNCSVALHSVMMSHLAVDRDYQRRFFLHDAHEAYLGDISSPVKRYLGPLYDMLVQRFDVVIHDRFNVLFFQHIDCWVTKDCDKGCLKFEKDNFMPVTLRPWPVLEDVSTTNMLMHLNRNCNIDFDLYYNNDDPKAHERLFLERASELGLL